MPKPLSCVVSVSGIRGIIGEDLDVEQVLGLAGAYGAVLGGGLVVLGRDSRPTGALLAQACAAGLRAAGCDVVDIGIVPTPTVPIAAVHLGAAGGIQISASHNPVQWNALKFFSKDGRNVDQAQLDAVLAIYRDGHAWKRWAACGSFRTYDQALTVHLDRVLAAVDVELIRAAALTVVIDSVNGSGSELAPRLLARLGCAVIPVHCRPDLVFPRDPEPTSENVRSTLGIVAASGADLGLVQDPDADRLALIDEQGTYIGEEYTLVLCAAGRLALAGREQAGGELVVCTNLSTSRMLEDVALRAGARVVRSKVGEAHVVDAMQAQHAVIGGEGNGGVIEPRVVWGRDSQIAMALVLDLLARRRLALSGLVREIPRYSIHKEKVALDRPGVARAIMTLRTHVLSRGAEVDDRDGLKLSWPDRWLHLRASGTEPASRIITEAPSPREAQDLADAVRTAIGASLVTAH